MGERAILVCEDLEGPAVQLAQILDFFEVPWERVGPGALADFGVAGRDEGYCVLAAMPLIGGMLMDRPGADFPPLLRRAESVFLFGGDSSAATRVLVQFVSRSASPGITPIQEQEILCGVSDRRTDVCGPLSGLQVPVPVREIQFAMSSLPASAYIHPLISTKEGCVFAVVDFDGTPCYLAPSPTVVDIKRPLEKRYFDVADHFLSSAPVVMYLRHAFANVMLGPAENGACLIVDDPVLRPKYGFFDFQRIAGLSGDHEFTCNVAFIPWNWRRSRSSVVELLKKNASRLSLSVHGCDHTALEFGSENAASMNAKAKLAQLRMKKHQRRTGLPFEALMVFPHGAFSSVTPTVLKHNGFVAAVNTELSPIDQPSRTEIADAWGMAILKYSDFAIYTRRYPFHGLHNFAFDALLGKPCLIVTHHGDFRNDCRDLVDFIDRLNSLRFRWKWRTLGEVIRRGYQQHFLPDGSQQIRMFGNEIFLENPSPAARRIVIEKMDRAPEGVECVSVDNQEIPFSFSHGRLRFTFNLEGQHNALIRIGFKDVYGDSQPARPLKRQIRMVARRWLSEFRDEAQARAPWVYAYAQKARNVGTRISKAA
jgi:hypothetical protein